MYEPGRSIFLTWRLHDSLPPQRFFPEDAVNSGEAFAVMDRLLDEARSGPLYLRQPAIGDMIVEADRVQRQQPRALLFTCLRGHAKSRSYFGYSGGDIAQANEIVERHHGQAG
jgi:hypothetical protein